MENIFHIRPSRFGTAGHDGWASAGAFFPAGNACANEMQAARFHIFRAANAVLVKGVAAINNDVTGLQIGEELIDKVIHGLTSLHEHHHAARAFEVGDHLRNGAGSDDICASRFAGHKLIHLGGGTIVGHDGEAVVVHI